MNLDNNFKFPDSANPKLSQKIAQKLSKGHIITKEVYNSSSSQLVNSELYNALFRDFEFYKSMFIHIGWNLVFSADGEFFYLSKVTDDDQIEEGDSNSLRICIPLFCIADSMVKRGFNTSALWSVNIGLSSEDIEILSTQEREISYLEAIGYKNNLWHNAIKNLKNKGFLYENSKGNIVFSSAAKYFTQRMIERFAK